MGKKTIKQLAWHKEKGQSARQTGDTEKYHNKLQGDLVGVVTNSLVLSCFISIQGALVIWQEYFLQKLNFPQYVSMKCRPPAVNIITANLNCNISQRFLCYISPKAPYVQFSLYKTGCEYPHHSIIHVLARTECLQHNYKSNYITCLTFIVYFTTPNKYFYLNCSKHVQQIKSNTAKWKFRLTQNNWTFIWHIKNTTLWRVCVRLQ